MTHAFDDDFDNDRPAASPPVRVAVFLDHTCPYSYMTFTAVRQALLERPAATHVEWHPLPLAGPLGRTTPAEEAMLHQRSAAEWPRIAQLAQLGFGLTLTPKDALADGRAAAGAVHWLRLLARPHSRPEAEMALHAALFAAYHHDGRDIGSSDVLVETVAGLGVETNGLAVALHRNRFGPQIEADMRMAADHGITAVPAVLLAGYLLVGAQPAAVLVQSIDQVQQADRLTARANFVMDKTNTVLNESNAADNTNSMINERNNADD